MSKNLDNLPCYFFAISSERVITGCNNTLAIDLHYSQDELIGLPVETIFTVSTRIFYQTHLGPLLKLQDNTSEIFITLKGKQGQILSVLCNARNELQDNNPVTFFISIGLENRKKFEDELIAARASAELALTENIALKDTQKELHRNMEILDANLLLISRQNKELKQINHVVTHELQEPLRKINLFADMLLTKENTPGMSKEDTIRKLMRASSRMRSVVEGLQTYIFLTENQFPQAQVDLNDVIEKEAAKLNSSGQDGLLIVQSVSLPAIHGAPDQIHMLFHELLKNCFQYRKPGADAAVDITSTVFERNKFQFTPGKYDYKNYLRIELRDHGIGFNPEYKDQIFELFRKLQQSDTEGLGLAYCKKIMDNHQGKIEVDSKEGAGTTIRLYFPEEAVIG